MSIEAMKQALEALERYMAIGTQYPDNNLEMELAPKAYDALRQAVEQAEKQEPVECMCGICTLGKREWVGLTDDDIKPLCDEWRIMFGSWAQDFARAIEAKLKEKNT